MNARLKSRQARITVESLEGRTLLSATSHEIPLSPRAALIAATQLQRMATDPAGVSAVLAAFNGGLGREWVSLTRSQVRNLGAVVRGFLSGQYTSYSIRGLTIRTPAEQPAFVGQPYDQLLPTAAGAAVFRNNVFELGAIMRGPFHNPETSYYVFGMDRGAGASRGPIFANRPGITPDALVTLTVGPYGSSASGTIVDLVSQSSQPISSSAIQIRGSVIRVFLNAKQFPSQGLRLQNYRFAFWTQTQQNADISTVPSFAPEASMIPIGYAPRVAVSR